MSYDWQLSRAKLDKQYIKRVEVISSEKYNEYTKIAAINSLDLEVNNDFGRGKEIVCKPLNDAFLSFRDAGYDNHVYKRLEDFLFKNCSL